MNLSSSLLNSILLANKGPYKAYDPSLAAGPDPEVFARTFHLQSWTTTRGDASATFAVRGGWLDLSTYADAAFWIDVYGLNNPATGAVSLTLESRPTKDIGKDTGTGETMPGTDTMIRDDCGSIAAYNTGTQVVPLNQSQVYEVQATSRSWTSAMNGKTQGTSATNTLGFYTSASLGGNLLIGPNFYYGGWAEVIFYSRILSASERALLVGYLNGRYGLGAK